jgi:hypothetical protein
MCILLELKFKKASGLRPLADAQLSLTFLVRIKLFPTIPLIFVIGRVAALSAFVGIFDVSLMIRFLCHNHNSLLLRLLFNCFSASAPSVLNGLQNNHFIVTVVGSQCLFTLTCNVPQPAADRGFSPKCMKRT